MILLISLCLVLLQPRCHASTPWTHSWDNIQAALFTDFSLFSRHGISIVAVSQRHRISRNRKDVNNMKVKRAEPQNQAKKPIILC